MKVSKYTLLLALVGILTTPACHDMLEQTPPSDIELNNFGRDAHEVNVMLKGCYAGMRKPLETEWMLTELRSDNSVQGSTGSSSTANLDLNDLDMFRPFTTHPSIYEYWLYTYQNIASANNVLASMPNVDDPALYPQYKGEALFIRSYHFFNLVRLFGPIFLPTKPMPATEAKKHNRIAVSVVYDTIINDLMYAANNLPTSYNNEELGRATQWAAKALLAKVYLTLERFHDAQIILEDIRDHSGHALLANYADVFSINNEMNNEMLFAIRYKSGGLGMGSPFANWFAPTSSGTDVINGNGKGYNYPTTSLRSAYGDNDKRGSVNIALYITTGKTTPYVRKYWSYVSVANDAENDWPVLRYSDVLLMLAEVKARQGAPADGMTELNQVRVRAGLAPYLTILTIDDYMNKLLNERRLEFAFENQRWFDLVRTNRAVSTLNNHIFNEEWSVFYKNYKGSLVPDANKIVTDWQQLLPIPQREIDTNNEISIVQNVGYSS